ncbi:MAG: CoA pyrophosphatase [Dehalococcoidia bacterium]
MLDRTHTENFAHALRAVLAGRVPSAEAMDGASPAGVLIPLRYHGGEWHVILNVRSHHVGQHKGEIAFPGGRLEPEDADMTACALRETWEEMGVQPEDVELLGPLDAVLTRTNFLVWPVVGVIPHPYPFVIDEREVADIIEVSLATLLDPSAVRHEARLQPDGSLLQRPSYACGDYLVFGATAWMLEQFLSVVRDLSTDPSMNSLKEAP